MTSRNSLAAYYVTRVAAATLLGACCLQAASAQDSTATDPDAAARDNWRAVMAHNTESGAGCFQAAYPSVVWEKVECKVAHPAVHPARSDPSSAGRGMIAGNGNDYVAQAAGLITETLGTFPTVTGVTSEKSVGVPAYGDGGILGPNEYTLQINTNFTGTTTACAGHSGCVVWQQFIYSPDYNTRGEAAVFMQYWLINWGTSKCPTGFGKSGEDCYGNSNYVAAPDMPITSLASLTISGAAAAGGSDTVVFNNGTTAYSVSGADSVLDISSVWSQSEFNIVGNAGGSRADFNKGSKVTVRVALTDGSTAAPTCVADDGTTGESNNLTLGKCTAVRGKSPFIQFSEVN